MPLSILKHLETYYPTGDYAQQAQLELLYAKFQQKDYEGAIAACRSFYSFEPAAS